MTEIPAIALSTRRLFRFFHPHLLFALICLTLTLGAVIDARAATLTVPAGGNFRTALDNAQAGDTIVLAAGATFTGPFKLPNKAGEGWITIRTSAPDSSLPAEGKRITPAYASVMPRVVAPGLNEPALKTAPGAHHYRFVGVEFRPATASTVGSNLIKLGEDEYLQTALEQVPHHLIFDRCYIHAFQDSELKRGIALNSGETEIINSYFEGFKSIGQDAQAICGWNGPGPFKILNNYLEGSGENVMFGGADPGIANLVPSDIEIRGNYFTKPLSWRNSLLAKPSGGTAVSGSASGGSLIAGTVYYYRIAARAKLGNVTAISPASAELSVTVGGAGSVVNLSWSAVDKATEYRVFRTADAPSATTRNWTYYTTTTLSYADAGSPGITGSAPSNNGTRWVVKNLFEIKNARRVRIEANVFENVWAAAQTGRAIVFKIAGSPTATWVTCEDIIFSNNIVRHAGGAISIQGKDYLNNIGLTKRITVRNNVFEDVNQTNWGGTGAFLTSTSGGTDFVIDHNTVFHSGSVMTSDGTDVTGLVYTNNLHAHNTYGVKGSAGTGTATLEADFPGYMFVGNVLAGGKASVYPAGNLFPLSLNDAKFFDRTHGNYRLASDSPLKYAGTDGKDIGADIDAIEAAMSGTASAPNSPPVATFTYNASGLTINCDASASADGDGLIKSYAWNFGDGSALGTGALAAHTYAAAGTYNVTLTVTDDAGAFSTTSRAVTLLAPAPSSVVTSVSVSPLIVEIATGETKQLSARVYDQNKLEMSGVSLLWSSSNPGVATVDLTGKVTALRQGTTYITASAGAISSGLVEVRVVKNRTRSAAK